jgi:uncharacterized protein YjbJ (UPF0337 family)
MVIEDFFEAVDRAFIQEAARIPAPLRLELKTPVELPLSAPDGSPATCSSERSRQPGRRYHAIPSAEEIAVTRKENRNCRPPRRKTVNKNQVSGKVEQTVGKVEQSIGETIGKDKLANQGVADQAKGAAKEIWGDAKDAVKEVQQWRKDTAAGKAQETRGKISQSVQDAKEKINEKIEELKEGHSS